MEGTTNGIIQSTGICKCGNKLNARYRMGWQSPLVDICYSCGMVYPVSISTLNITQAAWIWKNNKEKL